MGILKNLIMDQRILYETIYAKVPKYLIISKEKLMLLQHECLETDQYKIESYYDSASRKQIKSFCGMEIVEPKIVYGSDFKWALGD